MIQKKKNTKSKLNKEGEPQSSHNNIYISFLSRRRRKETFKGRGAKRSNQTFPRNLRPRKFVNASTIHGIERERETESSRILFRFTSQLSKGLAIMSSELKQLIVVVEGTAALGPYWQTIVSDYLLKIIRFLSFSSILILGFMRS